MVNPEISLLDGSIELIKQVGFPIAVCFWFMFRAEKKLDRNAKAVEDLTESIRNKL